MKGTGIALTLALLLSGGLSAGAPSTPPTPPVAPLRENTPDSGDARWHTIEIKPRARLPEIRFYDKFNPVWWFGNADEPKAPGWYLPDDQFRGLKWYFRNPFHNFSHYVIGVSDKPFKRSGLYPKHNINPRGGWNIAVSQRYAAVLPFVAYERDWFTFYFGWRERGNFGMKFNLRREPSLQPEKSNQVAKVAPPNFVNLTND